MPRKSKSQEPSPYEDLRAMWELPYSYQILKLLTPKFNFAKLSIQDFEDSIIETSSAVLHDVVSRLLRFLQNDSTILSSNFETCLSKLIAQREAEDENHNLLKSGSLTQSTPTEKLQILRWIIDEAFERQGEVLEDFLNDTYSPDQLRPTCVGQDAFNNNYWYLDDLRLYKEAETKKGCSKAWETVCVTLSDWRQFLRQYRKSTNQQELELSKYVREELFPLVEATFECRNSNEAFGESFELDREFLMKQEREEVNAMLKDSESMSQDVNGSGLKSEKGMDIKEENGEDASQKSIDNCNSNPNSNKMANGDMGKDSQMKHEELSPTNKTQAMSAGPNKKAKVEKSNTPGGASDVSHKSPGAQQSPMPPGGQTKSQQMAMSMEPPFMQQQSQIFVFSTNMANKAAEAVVQGQYKNMLDFHMDQPATKKFLQKNPLKPSQIGRAIQMGNPRNPNPHMMKGQPMGGFGPNASSSIEQWVQQQNANLKEQGMGMPMPNNMNGPMFPNNNPRMMGWQPNQGPMGPNFPRFSEFDEFAAANNMNLLQNKVPNESLTPEQLHRREEQLANLRKIQQMLFPDQQRGPGGPQQHPQFPPGPGPGPGQGMMPDGMGMQGGMFQQGMMTSPHGMMSQQQGMMSPNSGMMGSPHGMMSQQQQMMMSQQGMSQFGPGGPPPQNNLSPAQREWLRLQQEFYTEKRMMGRPPNMDHNGPPPPYYSSVGHKRPGPGPMGMNPSTSPNLNGPPMHGMGPEQEMGMFPRPRGRPSQMDPMMGGPGFSPPGIPPQGPGFEPGMIPNMPGGRVKKSQISLHRAGNPEQFQPDQLGPGGGPPGNPKNSKPPPSYAATQAQKRKRDDLDDLYKNLQPTPSPQQINYLNQFEGQELTITKQLNSAFRESGIPPNEPQPPHLPNHFQQNQVHSPMHGPGSNKGPMSNSSQNSSVGPLSSPGPMSGPSPMSGANMRLSHYDPPSNNSKSSAPNTPTAKSSMSNITSASLANLAKGVEHLSNRMQQDMMQGGPFHSIQVQGQMNNGGGEGPMPGPGGPQQQQPSQQHPPPGHVMSPHPPPGHVMSPHPPAGHVMSPHPQQPHQHPPHMHPPGQNPNPPMSHPQQQQQQHPGNPSSISQSQSTPSVNNTYVNATMSIQQLNIQSVNAPNQPGGGNYNPSMQVQQMNNESPMTVPGGPPSGSVPGSMPPHGPPMSSGPTMSQAQMMTSQGPSSMGGKPPQFPSPNHPSMAGGPGNPMMGPGGPGTGRMSPNFPSSSVGNANVQIQPKAPNTIQYLPANPPANQPNMMGQKRPDLDFMQGFPNSLTNMDGKAPTSTLQYFPNNSPPHSGRPGIPSPFSQQQHMAMQQSMMMREPNPEFPGMPPGPGMHPGGMPMDGPGGMMAQMGPGGNMPPEQMMQMGPGMGPGGPGGPMPGMNSGPQGPMGPMSPMDPRMGNGPNNPNFMSNGQAMMNQSMMQSQHMQMQGGPGPMPNMPNMGNMPMQGPGPGMQRQPNPGMRMGGQGNPSMPQGGPGGPGAFNAHYQQFQQQLYSQSRPRQLSPMGGMMGSPGQPYMGMMPNMHGPT